MSRFSAVLLRSDRVLPDYRMRKAARRQCFRWHRLLELYRNLTNALWLFIFFSLPLSLSGQAYISETRFYGVKEGLSHRQVNAVLEDRQGFIWVATPSGLNRFDGYTFHALGREDGLQSDRIEYIFEDAYGLIWIVYPQSTGGIDLLDPRNLKVVPFAAQYGDKIPNGFQDKVGRPVLAKDSTLYWATQYGYVAFHPKRGYRQVTVPAMNTDPAARLLLRFVSSKHTVWGVLRKRGMDCVVEVDSNGALRQIMEHPGRVVGFLEPGQQKEGAAHYFDSRFQDDKKQAFYVRVSANNTMERLSTAEMRLPLDTLFSLENYARICDDQLLFANQQVYDLAAGRLLFDYRRVKLDINERPRTFLIDRSDRIWLGTDYGLMQISIRKNKFKRYLYNPGAAPKGFSCRGILEYGRHLVVNTETAVFTCDKTTGQCQRYPGTTNKIPGIENVYWYGLTSDSAGRIFSAWRQGLDQLVVDSNKIRSTVAQDLYVPWSLYPDSRNRLWIGTNRYGLLIYDLEHRQLRAFTRYNGFDELIAAGIIAVLPDRAGNIWLCATTGLYRLDMDKGITERHWPGGKGVFYLPHDNIYHFYEDASGVFWLATGGGGLIWWDRKRGETRQYSTKAGLPNNTVYAVYEDEYGHLWLPSDYGLIQFDKSRGIVRRVYLPEDGITHPEFNRISHCRGADGTLYFGGMNGITAFHPRDFYGQNEAGSIPLVVTRFQQFNGNTNQLEDKTADLRTTRAIILRPDDRFFNLEFALLSFTQTDKIQYAFNIEGVDSGWIYQNEPRLRLSRLPYGTHHLRIRGQAANGLWGANDLDFRIYVLRPFYLQAWFLLLVVVLLALLVRFFFKWRTQELQLNQRRLEAEVQLQTEKIQKQTEELRQLDSLKTRLYTNITHEFRTPLTVMLGMADEIEELEKNRKNNAASPIIYAASLIRRNGKNLLRLINQMLDLSKLDSGSMQTHWVQADIIGFLQYLTESFYSLAQDKQVRLTFYPETPELVMDFDEEKVQIIVYNLLSNAIKFTGEGGKVVLHAARTTHHAAPFLQLKVQDTGVGIAENELPHIFDRFYQADNSTTRKGEGTGIGLALTKELVDWMGGSISVESTPGKGTVFTLLLPAGEVHAAEAKGSWQRGNDSPDHASPVDKSTAQQRSESITNTDKPLLLLIEDNRDVVTYIGGLLQRDYQIETAANGQIGIERACEIIPDIIISDVMMPEKDGYEVCDTLKHDERTSHIPIILLTAKSAQEDKVAGLRAGADAYLQKPFDKAELLIRLEKLVEIRQLLRARYGGGGQPDMPANLPSETTAPTLNDIFLLKIRRAIESKMDDPELGIQQLCQAAHLSHTQVFRKLKALTGENPTLYIRKMRLHRALQLLQTTAMTVSEIAYTVGFSDPNYFSRVFHETFGKAPGALRK